MKHTLFIFALITASIQTFAQSPRIKLNQITKDSLTGSVLISSPSDSGMVYSRDLFISYGADTVLILGGDTLAATSGIISSVLSDGVTITGNGTTGSELTVDTTTVIATKGDLDLYYLDSNPDGYTSNTGTVTSVGGTGTVNGISLSGTVTSSGNLTLGGTLSNVNLASQVTGTLPIANGGTGSDTLNFVDLTNAQTVGGAKTFTSTVTGTRFDPTSSSTTGTGMFLSATNTLGLSTNGSERMTIDASGNVGIGTTSPSTYGGKFVTYSSGGYAGINTAGQVFSYQLLDVATAGGRLTGGSNQGYLGDIGIEQTATGAKGGYIRFSTAPSGTNTPSERMRITSAGYVGIGNLGPSYPLQMGSGAHVTAGGVWTNASDIKLKTNINYIYPYGLEDIMNLKPTIFDYKNGEKNSLGFIAQDVYEYIPEAISSTLDEYGNETMGLKMVSITATLTKAIQEQQAIIESQATEIEQLKSQIQLILSEIEQIKNN